MRVVIIGSGSMGTTHAAGWHSLATDGVTLVGIVSANRASAEVLTQHYGGKVFETLAEVLPLVDVVDICVPTDLHLQFTLQAAAAKKHIFCEKPIARTLADAQQMIEACNAAQVRLFIGQVVRFFPQYQSVQRALTQGKIGELAVLRLTRVSYRPQKEAGSWFMDFSRSGGPLLDMLVHDYDYARWLGGDVARVYTRVSPPDAGGISDYAQVLMRFRSGAIAHLEGGWCYPPGMFRTKIEAAGTGGLIEWDSDSTAPITSYIKTQPGAVADVGLPLSPLTIDPYAAIIQHFYEAVVNDLPFAVTPEDALAALQIGLAAIESAQSGKPVTLPK